MSDQIEPTQEQIVEAYSGLIAAVQKILHQEAIFQDNIIAGVRLMANKLSDNRQHTMWAVEEMVRMRKRINMMETGLESCIGELRILKAGHETVQHYTRVHQDDMTVKIQRGVPNE